MKNRLLTVTVAFIAGLGGGIISRVIPVTSTTPPTGIFAEPIRATRIALVDKYGRTTAFIGEDNQGNTALVFLDRKGHERAKFGVGPGSAGDTPLFEMNGDNGHSRVSISLSGWHERPMIQLGDEDRERVSLGFFTNDAPSPKDEDWSLVFYPPTKDTIPLKYGSAGIGLHRAWEDDKIEGYVYALQKDGKNWSGLKR